ncbi:enoyl-CoA hydratase-related protein [Nocardioides dubius]|uniref:Enoyl-CoA hydratase family protein n=1 Tax=Nocardioides dubius TaxID=317019 RepID=A0ABP4EDC0_9ACTN
MSIRIARSEGVVEITLDRPEKRNAMTDAMWAQLEAHLASIDPASGDRVLVITGAGEAFCGGSDVDGLLDDLPSLPARIDVSNRCVLAMRELPIPTIAKVDGIAAGSALNLALACDLLYASDRARFAQLFVHIGLSVDSGASWLLPRLVGERKARELCLLGEQVSAADALAIGMISKVVPAAELAATVAEVASRLAGYNPAALAGTKRMVNQTWQLDLAGALRAETSNQVAVIRTDHARTLIERFTRR